MTDKELKRLLESDWTAAYQQATLPEQKVYAMEQRQKKVDYMKSQGTYDDAWDKTWDDAYNADPNKLTYYNSKGQNISGIDLNKPIGETIGSMKTMLANDAKPQQSAQASSFATPAPSGGYSYDEAPSFTSQYKAQIDQLLNGILNRDDFEYNAESDPLFQQYKDSYSRMGNRAMKDTIGEVAANTGGLASSYATTAASQANDNYMSALNDKIPELQQVAYNMYLKGIDNQARDLGLLQNMDDTQYGRYRDSMGDYFTNRDFDYGSYRDSIGDARYADETAYNRGRDTVMDDRYTDETAYNRDRDAQADAIYKDETAYNRAQDAKQWQYTLDETAYQRSQDALAQKAQKDAAAFANAITKWGMTGTLDANSAAILGIPAGTKSSDYMFRQAELALSQSSDNRAWEGYYYNVQKDAEQKTADSNSGRALKNYMNTMNYISQNLEDKQTALDYLTSNGTKFLDPNSSGYIGEEYYKQLYDSVMSGYQEEPAEDYTQGFQDYAKVAQSYLTDSYGNRNGQKALDYINGLSISEDMKDRLAEYIGLSDEDFN